MNRAFRGGVWVNPVSGRGGRLGAGAPGPRNIPMGGIGGKTMVGLFGGKKSAFVRPMGRSKVRVRVRLRFRSGLRLGGQGGAGRGGGAPMEEGLHEDPDALEARVAVVGVLVVRAAWSQINDHDGAQGGQHPLVPAGEIRCEAPTNKCSPKLPPPKKSPKKSGAKCPGNSTQLRIWDHLFGTQLRLPGGGPLFWVLGLWLNKKG